MAHKKNNALNKYLKNANPLDCNVIFVPGSETALPIIYAMLIISTAAKRNIRAEYNALTILVILSDCDRKYFFQSLFFFILLKME